MFEKETKLTLCSLIRLLVPTALRKFPPTHNGVVIVVNKREKKKEKMRECESNGSPRMNAKNERVEESEEDELRSREIPIKVVTLFQRRM